MILHGLHLLSLTSWTAPALMYLVDWFILLYLMDWAYSDTSPLISTSPRSKIS